MEEKSNVKNNDAYKKNIVISSVAFITMIFVNYVSSTGFINGNSQSVVSKKFPTMITPAGFTFSIWGLIYFSIFFCIVLTIFRKKQIDIVSINAIFKLFIISSILNIAWTFVFAYELIWLSAIIILALLINIFIIMKKLKTISKDKISFFDFAFGLYAGWLSIATVVNIMAFLVSIKFNFFNNPKLFYSVLLLVFIFIMIFIQNYHNNPFYLLAIVWAFFGIIKRLSFDSYVNPLFLVLIFGMSTLFISDFLITVRNM